MGGIDASAGRTCAAAGAALTPLDYLLRVIGDPTASPERRLEAAKACIQLLLQPASRNRSLADAGLKASTITRRCAAIAYAYRLKGLEPPAGAQQRHSRETSQAKQNDQIPAP